MPTNQTYPEEIGLAIVIIDNEAGVEEVAAVPIARPSWHPKITPFRLLNLLLPTTLGTVKAVASQSGSQNEPITLEWIAGVVVFILLFNTGTYESRPIHRIPAQLSWLFKYDCMDMAWWLRSKLSRGSLHRPSYISDDAHAIEGTIYIVTSYRLLVCATVVSIGILKAVLTYTGQSTGATWVDWVLGVLVSSVLYIIGLYESNTVGLYTSFFGRDRANVVRSGLHGTAKLLMVLISLLLMSLWFAIERPYSSPSKIPDGHTDTELPFMLRAYNNSVMVLVEAVFVLFFALGAVVLFASLRAVREDLGDDLGSRIDSFFAAVASRGTRLSPLISNAQLLLRRGIYVLRHILSFIIACTLIVLAFSFSAGQIYRVSTGDIDAPSNQKLTTTPHTQSVNKGLANRGAGWHAFAYISLGLMGLVIILPAGVVAGWAAREMLRRGKQVAVQRYIPAVRIIWKGARDAQQKARRQVGLKAAMIAGETLLRVVGLGNSEETHYAYLELVWTIKERESG